MTDEERKELIRQAFEGIDGDTAYGLIYAEMGEEWCVGFENAVADFSAMMCAL